MRRIHDFRRERLGFGREIRRFEAVAPGRYAVDGVGEGVAAGDRIRFTLKGSKALELVLEVEQLRPRLIPPNGWEAVLTGPDFTDLEIREWGVLCDRCGTRHDVEFAAPADCSHEALVASISARIRDLGWAVERDAHVCPTCCHR